MRASFRDPFAKTLARICIPTEKSKGALAKVLFRQSSLIQPKRRKNETAIRSLAIEGIFGHMATHKIHSLEAGLVLIGDGSDMEKGRARIPTMLSSQTRVGDIHRTSASAIQKVKIFKGQEKPINITVEMNASVGFFQVEEVFFPKINISPVKPYIELYAGVTDREMLRYL